MIRAVRAVERPNQVRHRLPRVRAAVIAGIAGDVSEIHRRAPIGRHQARASSGKGQGTVDGVVLEILRARRSAFRIRPGLTSGIRATAHPRRRATARPGRNRFAWIVPQFGSEARRRTVPTAVAVEDLRAEAERRQAADLHEEEARRRVVEVGAPMEGAVTADRHLILDRTVSSRMARDPQLGPGPLFWQQPGFQCRIGLEDRAGPRRPPAGSYFR